MSHLMQPAPQLAQTRQRNRRHWLVRIGVAFLVLMLMVIFVTLIAMRSNMSPEEANKAYQQLSDSPTSDEMIQLLGKPAVEYRGNDESLMLWYFCNQSLWSSEVFRVAILWKNGEVKLKQGTLLSYSGWESWQWQWQLLTMRLKR